MSDHIALEELADAAAGVLDDRRTGQIQAHTLSCAECRDTWDALAEVSDLLGALPQPVMPPEVAQRLGDAIAAEQRRTVAAAAAASVPAAHARTLGAFGADLAKPPRTRLVLGALMACVAAGVVGFGGYVLSASAGLNEPSSTAPAVVSTSRLAAQANSLLRGADLSPHRFSQAWRCARNVTGGRITAITNAVVDGRPALLVYTRSDDVAQVTVVTGCEDAHPVAGPSTTLER